MKHGLDIRQCACDTHVRRNVLYRLTPTLGRCPLHALDQHHPSHLGVRPVLALHDALSSSPPSGNQEGRGLRCPDSVCDRDVPTLHPLHHTGETIRNPGGGITDSQQPGSVMGILPMDRKHWDMSNAEHRPMMLGETREIDVLMPTLWQGYRPPSWEPAGRPPRQRAYHSCTIPIPEMYVHRMRPTMPFTRHVPQSARPLQRGIPNVSFAG
jgi:hypothetical protein